MALVHKQEYVIAKVIVGLGVLAIIGAWVAWFIAEPSLAILVPIGLGIVVGCGILLLTLLWVAAVFEEERKRKREEKDSFAVD